MKNPYRYTSVSAYPSDLEYLGRDAESRLATLCGKWRQTTPDQREECRAAAHALVVSSRQDGIRAKAINVRISDEARVLLLEIGNGNISAGVRIILGLMREVLAPDTKQRTVQWYTFGMRSDLMYRASILMPGKSFPEMLRTAHAAWQILPIEIKRFLRHTACYEDTVSGEEEGRHGPMSAKLECAMVAEMLLVGKNKSAGARIMLRTLCDVLEGCLTAEYCASFDPAKWENHRAPKLPPNRPA